MFPINLLSKPTSPLWTLTSNSTTLPVKTQLRLLILPHRWRTQFPLSSYGHLRFTYHYCSPLKAQFALVSSAPSESEGNFSLSTSTSFAPLDLAFTTIPVDSVVNLVGSTTSSPVNVSLTEAFEGTLQARSSFEQITFIAADAEDPKGQHRKRHVETNQRGPLNEILEGEVYWEGDDRATPLGSVDVQTSAAEITLLL
jgi:hypothetical protein